MPASVELIELYAREGVAQIDTQGQRKLNVAEARLLALRLLDIAASLDEACPLVPFHDQIVVSIIEETDRQSIGGVALPDTARETALRGVVEAVGPLVGREGVAGNVPMVGDIIAFSHNAGTVTKIGDRPYLTMKANYALTRIRLGDGQPS